MTAADIAQPMFSEALDAIQRYARGTPAFWPAPRNGRGLRLDDLLGLRLELATGAPGALFDHRVYDRVFQLYPQLTEAYLSYWNAAVPDPAERLAMCQLFLLHELLHVGQSAHSDVYLIDGRSTQDLYTGLDYMADAQALQLAFDMQAAGLGQAGRKAAWVRLMGAQLHGGAVFGAVDGGTASASVQASMEGARLRRQSVWALQYARAAAYLPESDGWAAALAERIEWQWLVPSSSGEPAGIDLCDQPRVEATALALPLRGHFTVGGRQMIRHEWLHPIELRALAALLFRTDLSGWHDAYRRLFDSHPFLTGRGPDGSAVQPGVTDEPLLPDASVHPVKIRAPYAQVGNGSALYAHNIFNYRKKKR